MAKQAACLAVLGTGSDVGKSIVTTALCRIFVNRGLRVAPFKAQNMSNNSGVTPEGMEMGRAQIVQAEAARVAPHCDMNPVLLKPVSDVGSQVVLGGVAWMDASAQSYTAKKDFLFAESKAALDRLRQSLHAVLYIGAAHRSRALGAQRHLLLAAVFKSISLFLNYIGALTDGAHKQAGLFKHRCFDTPVAVAAADLRSLGFNISII